MRRDYARAGPEPALEEVLAAPIVRLVMRRDGVKPGAVRSIIAAVRRRLFSTVAEPCGPSPGKGG